MQAASALSPAQSAFLNENFDLWNSQTQTTHQNYEELLTTNVHFIGEEHHLPFVHRIQNTYFQLFGVSQSLLLTEGVEAGVKEDRSDYPYWPDLPNEVEILGADSRAKGVKDRLQAHRLNQLLMELKRRFPAAAEKAMDQLTTLLNDSVHKGDAKIADGYIQVSKSIHETILKLLEEVTGFSQRADALNKAKQALVPASTNTSFLESNVVLCNLVKKHQPTHKKIVAIWGYSHFVLGEELFKKLNTAKVAYSVLVPNEKLQKRMRDADEEMHPDRWPCTLTPILADTFNDPRGAQAFTIMLTNDARAKLIPPIQALVETSAEPVEFNPSVLFKANSFTLAPKTRLRFTQLSIDDFLRVLEMEERGGSLEAKRNLIQKILRIALLFDSRQFTKIAWTKSEGLQIVPECVNMKHIATLYSPDQLTIECITDRLIVSVDVLLVEMVARKITAFEIQPKQLLCFTDIDTKEIDRLCKNPQKLNSVLNTLAPTNIKVSLEGYEHPTLEKKALEGKHVLIISVPQKWKIKIN